MTRPSMLLRSLGLTMIVLAAVVPSVSAAHFTTLSTSLSGAEEVPGPGDPNGKGWISLDVFTSGTICWEAKIQALSGVSAAHIHLGAAGTAGGVVVDLRPDMAEMHGSKASWCVTTSTTTAGAIIASPSSYYVNVHNADYPAGAVRGQLGD